MGQFVFKFFKLLRGVRQGGVLSPFLFAVFVDSVLTDLRLLDLAAA